MNALMSERQRIMLETTTARDKAETLLRGLLDARATYERHAKGPRNQRTSIDNAIASTQHMVEALNRTLNTFKAELSDEDLALLDEG